MKISPKSLVLITVVSATLGLASFTSGCAATATRQSTGEFVDDAAITAKVKADLIKDPVVKAHTVNVETFKGVVQLSGFVNTESEKAQAGSVAGLVNGVTEVKNNIVVK